MNCVINLFVFTKLTASLSKSSRVIIGAIFDRAFQKIQIQKLRPLIYH